MPLPNSPQATTDQQSIPARMVFREVTEENWRDFETLFECRGGPKACWCMAWRAKQSDDMTRKAAMHARITSGIPVGILGYLDDQPVAWCSVAPRSTYRRLVDDDNDDQDDQGIWSIACFFILRRLRGQGVSRRILAAAIDFARSRSASVVEAYPVDPTSPSYRFMGFVPLFAAAGFHEVGHAGSRRHVFRLNL